MVDFEFACVNYAVKDLTWAFTIWLFNPKLRRSFIKKYLECMGDSTSDDNVDEIILEVEYFSIVLSCMYSTSYEELHRSDNPRYDFMIFRKTKQLFEEAKTDQKLRYELLESVY